MWHAPLLKTCHKLSSLAHMLSADCRQNRCHQLFTSYLIEVAQKPMMYVCLAINKRCQISIKVMQTDFAKMYSISCYIRPWYVYSISCYIGPWYVKSISCFARGGTKRQRVSGPGIGVVYRNGPDSSPLSINARSLHLTESLYGIYIEWRKLL